MNTTKAQQAVAVITAVLNAALTEHETGAAAAVLTPAVPDDAVWAELLEKLNRHRSVGAYVDAMTGQVRWRYDDILVIATVRTGDQATISEPTLLHDVGDLLAAGGLLDDLYAAAPTVPCLVAAANVRMPDGTTEVLALRDQRGIGMLAAASDEARKALRGSGLTIDGKDPLGERQFQTRKQYGAADDWQRARHDDWAHIVSGAIYEWFARRPREHGYDWRLAPDEAAVSAFVAAPAEARATARSLLPNRPRHVLNELQQDTTGGREGSQKSAKQLQRERRTPVGSTMADDDLERLAAEQAKTARCTGDWLKQATRSPEGIVMRMLEGDDADDPEHNAKVRRAATLAWVMGNFDDAATGVHPVCTEKCGPDCRPEPAVIGWSGDGQSTAYVVGLCDDQRTGLRLSDIGLGRVVVPKRDGTAWRLLVTRELADLFGRRVRALMDDGADRMRATYRALADCGWSRVELQELANQVTTKEGRSLAHWRRPEDVTHRRSNDLCDEASERLRAVMEGPRYPGADAIGTLTELGLTGGQAAIVAMARAGHSLPEIAEVMHRSTDSVRHIRSRALKILATQRN